MPVARKLREMGHEVILIVRELHDMETLLRGQGFALLQAPIWLRSHPELGQSPLNYSDILARHGYLAAEGLMSLMRAWLGLWSLLRPDLIVAEYAPTALLSARAAAVPAVMLGTGFYSPPSLRLCPICVLGKRRRKVCWPPLTPICWAS
ncbi:hypothetical protein [Methylogaea oryzae]|uniref:hypothetical protein n=1 Tax=Methylogaea oryzae TaxID=1295382 RepID=UPI0012E30F2A|nr:hypothetical protein [Methylogaea oryzae]